MLSGILFPVGGNGTGIAQVPRRVQDSRHHQAKGSLRQQVPTRPAAGAEAVGGQNSSRSVRNELYGFGVAVAYLGMRRELRVNTDFEAWREMIAEIRGLRLDSFTVAERLRVLRLPYSRGCRAVMQCVEQRRRPSGAGPATAFATMRKPPTSLGRRGLRQSPSGRFGVPFLVDARNGASMPQWSDYSTGERIKILRGREIRQSDLAEMTDLSIVTIQKAEQDKALSLPTLLAIADALSVDTSVILGQQAPRRALAQGDRNMIRELSRAVHDTAAGIVPESAEPATFDELETTTARCWDLYWAGRYAEVGAIVAPFITAAAARLHDQAESEQAPAWGVLSDAYRIAGYVANLMGARDLAYAAIGHSQMAAERAADDLRGALVRSGRAWVYLRDARLREALSLAERSAAEIEPRFSRATPGELAAYGSHVNFAAVVASRMGDKDRAADFLSQSHATGARMGREVRAHGTLFGPVSAATQAVGVNVALGQTGKALTLIDSIHDVSSLTAAAQNRYAMDKTVSYVVRRMSRL
ncbi:helix-turn-helix transcriptional regulator [Streptomyces sp. NPDC005876]|uniref:helix-turn-helix domain-containing protein n=1 Tax=Streptomyces sp. NPDC005876 TaxID=3157076 RepID=UPI0033CF4408